MATSIFITSGGVTTNGTTTTFPGSVVAPALQVSTSTIAGLPSPVGIEGAIRGVTDALVPVSLAIVAAGGAVHVSVYSNGTNWIVL